MRVLNAPTPATRMNAAERKRRKLRKESYHLVASRSRLPADPEEEDEDMLFRYLLTSPPPQQVCSPSNASSDLKQIRHAKTMLLRALGRSGGDVATPEVESAVKALCDLVDPADLDVCRKTSSSLAAAQPDPSCSSSSLSSLSSACQATASSTASLDGMWVEISKPKFQECLGTNENGDFQYLLGRMSFDMLQPGNLICSIQGAFNPIHEVDAATDDTTTPPQQVPEAIRSNVKLKQAALWTYDVISAFTIEAGQEGPDGKLINKPLQGLMTTYGYVVSDPDQANRLSVWFTDGSLEVVNNKGDTNLWFRIFESRGRGATTDKKNNTLEPDGRMFYHLEQPVHNGVYIDILYMDETMRIVRSSCNLIYVFSRVPYFPDE